MNTLADLLWKIYRHQIGNVRMTKTKIRDLESVACESMLNHGLDRVRLDSTIVAHRSHFNTIHFASLTHAGDIPILDDLATSLAEIEMEVA